MIVVDTSGLLAAVDSSQRDHARAAAALRAADGPRLLSPFVLCELDYLINQRVSAAAARAFLQQVVDQAYRLEPMGTEDIAAATDVIDRYRDLELGIADASLVIIAERHGVTDLLTLDERHFRAVRGPGGQPFRLLPADS